MGWNTVVFFLREWVKRGHECTILAAVHHFLDKRFKKDHQFYGGGVASATIARVLASSA
jgi:hypothetical protein